MAATSAPFNPIDVLPIATACHECAAVPGTQVAVLKPAVGTFQLTSPTSVEPPPPLIIVSLNGYILPFKPTCGLSRVNCKI